jgi:hypothetical protein
LTASDPPYVALPVAHALLRLLIGINWLMAAAIITLLLLPHERWIMTSLDLVPSPEARRVVTGLRAIAVLGLIAIPVNHVVFRRLLAVVETVRAGDPFVASNAPRLLTIAWSLFALQLLSVIIGLIGKAISTPERPIDIGAGFSVNGWLAVLLTFLLARVFSEGTRMRDDLEGVV